MRTNDKIFVYCDSIHTIMLVKDDQMSENPANFEAFNISFVVAGIPVAVQFAVEAF